MKRIIDGKKYDTETATEIATDGPDLDPTDPFWWTESLYATAKGNYFTAGVGNTHTHFHRMGFDDELMATLSDEEARAWCETHADVETTEKLFDIEVG